MGTGMGGLVAAQRLSKHFDEVVSLERDARPQLPPAGGNAAAVDGPSAVHNGRPGVPQFNFIHALLGRGGAILDDSFGPDYRSQLLAAGGRLVDWFTEVSIVVPPGTTFLRNPPGSAPPPGLPPMGMYSASRALLEGTARKLLERNPRVTVRYGARADGLAFSPDEGTGGRPAAVEGVTLAGGGAVVGADLVVDCSGRNTRVADWLAAAGWEAPPVSVVDAGVGYVSRHFRLSPESQHRMEGTHALVATSMYPHTQLAVIQRIEGGDFLVGVGGYGEDESGLPPHDDSALLPWVQGMWWPEVGELLRGSTPLGPSYKFYGVKNVHRRYDAVALPEGLALLGDTVCSFNPVYGQGMTVAAIEAELLDSMIAARLATAEQGVAGGSPRQLLAGLGSQHARESAALIADAWGLAAGMDLLNPWAKGTEERGPGFEERMGFTKDVMELCGRDPQVHQAMSKVWHMYEPAAALMDPSVVSKVDALRSSRKLLGAAPAGRAGGAAAERV